MRGCLSSLASIWHDVQELSRNFTSFSLCYVNREVKVAAHLSAKFADLVNIGCTWVNGIPNFLADALTDDCKPANLI
jgi:hypothetical protein